jgi:hypothetical protein
VSRHVLKKKKEKEASGHATSIAYPMRDLLLRFQPQPSQHTAWVMMANLSLEKIGLV